MASYANFAASDVFDREPDVNAHKRASAVVLLHNAVPALVKLAILGRPGAVKFGTNVTPDYSLVGALRECYATSGTTLAGLR